MRQKFNYFGQNAKQSLCCKTNTDMNLNLEMRVQGNGVESIFMYHKEPVKPTGNFEK